MRALARQLSETDGFELLTACTADIEKVPWAKISQTKTGEETHDNERANQLKNLLHTQAGLAFYYQLFCASTSEMSQLHHYDWLQGFDNNEYETTHTGLILSRTSGELRILKFVHICDRHPDLGRATPSAGRGPQTSS